MANWIASYQPPEKLNQNESKRRPPQAGKRQKTSETHAPHGNIMVTISNLANSG